MANPRSVVYNLYLHWTAVDALTRLSREQALFTYDQVLATMAKVKPQDDIMQHEQTVRTLINSDILQSVPRSSDLQLNAYVLDFVRNLTREHELGLAEVLRARVLAIRQATEGLNEAVANNNIEQVLRTANKLAELFRQISLQLEQDKHALFELAERAKSAGQNMPMSERYRYVLEAYDNYVEPMIQMMDSSAQSSFYRYLENAEYALELAREKLTVQGILFSHKLQLRSAAYQAKELRRFGRLTIQQCADTLLPLREELRQHSQLTNAISTLLGVVRKRGLNTCFSATAAITTEAASSSLPVWCNERGFRLHLGDELRTLMAAALEYQPQAVAFPTDEPTDDLPTLELIDKTAIKEHLSRSLPVECLLQWLSTHYGHLQDGNILTLFHELITDPNCQSETNTHQQSLTRLKEISIQHYPHRLRSAS